MNAIVSSSDGPFVGLLVDKLCAGIRNGVARDISMRKANRRHVFTELPRSLRLMRELVALYPIGEVLPIAYIEHCLGGR